ncbi:ATP-grasp domain-containing protein [Oceanobacillus halotolerans]|uniref:ATP-grasp domain-containing protein n=1 Tax=Oceanobacillus halotolerans TaxID=2663380 RepID=UPI0013DBE0E4|nr:ATP-grasp domain-containing protein [Oceanobacillus halotolerans]
MENINVLVTGIGGPTAQGIINGLRKIDNINIIGVDRRSMTSGHQFCDKTYQVPRYTQKDQYRKAIIDIIHTEQVHAIFPSLHEEISLYQETREDWGAIVALPKSDNFPILLNKENTYEFLIKMGLGSFVPRYYGFNGPDELRQIKYVFFPDERFVVTKIVDGHGSLGFAILASEEDYLKALKEGRRKIYNINDYCKIIDQEERKIVMEYIEGIEYSVDVFMHEGQVVVAVPRERSGVSNGIVLDGTVIYHEELIHASSEIAKAIATDGFLNLQFMKSKDGFKLTDVNPRFCGSQIMSLGARVNFPYLFLQYNLLQEFVSVTPRWNTRMLRYREHFFVYQD